MTIRFCGACGTEVDETAAFCPSCGRPLDDQAPEPSPAPAWDDEVESGSADALGAAPEDETLTRDELAAELEPEVDDEPEREVAPPDVEPEPSREPEPVATAPPAQPAGDEPQRRAASSTPPRTEGRTSPLPVSWPGTLSGWLIGLGALVGIVSVFLPWTIGPAQLGLIERWGLVSPINLLMAILLLAVAATVFIPTRLPRFAYRRLAVLCVALIGLGIGLDRLALGSAGAGVVLFFVGMLSATIGALMQEVGADRPIGPVGRT